MKKLLNESEKDQIKLLYESKGILLFEDTIWGALAKKALSWIGKNEDDIALLFKTTEKTLAKSIDDIVEVATKAKSVEQLDDIQMKLMHFYNPSGAAQNIPKAQQQMKNFLNGFAKSKGKQNWTQIKDEVLGKVESQAASSVVKDMFKGQRVSNRWYGFYDPSYSKNIEWDKILNAKNMDDYNKLIAKAIQTGDYKYLSRGGFEKFGISNFREYLQNNIATVNQVEPSVGRWSVIFK
jgi:hypothetical protein